MSSPSSLHILTQSSSGQHSDPAFSLLKEASGRAVAKSAVKELAPDSALVLFSGGQDSATCLVWALAHFERVETIGFSYNQRHAIELECRTILREKISALKPEWQTRLGADHMVDLASLGALSDTALTREAEIEISENGLPNTFVPGRNLIFLTFAAALAFRRSVKHIVTGVCETDYSGYPDCRDDTIKALQVALNLGMAHNFVLHTPLMWIDKARTWQLGESLGGSALVEIIRTESHSCYKGDRTHLHPWGYGCNDCPACALRAEGWDIYMGLRQNKEQTSS